MVDGCLPKDDLGEFDAEGERSDVVHDLLAHLAEEMIRMNKEKQEAIRCFLAWPEKVEVEEAVGRRAGSREGGGRALVRGRSSDQLRCEI